MDSFVNRRYQQPSFQASSQPTASSNLSQDRGQPEPGIRPTPIRIIKASNYAVAVPVSGRLGVPGNKHRKYLFIQNRGIQNVFMAWGAQPTDSPTFASAVLIPPNGFREWSIHCPTDDVYFVSAASTQLVSVEQGIEFIEYE